MAESNEENRKLITIQEFNKDDIANIKWIITPGLKDTVNDFIKQYDYLKSKTGRKVPIMILGDRGVGKSLLVHIYKRIYEKDNPGKNVVTLNAASLAVTLVDSELFGHKKGAFTDAIENRVGLVEKANLLILEEIGDIPTHVQAKLLTFIEDRKFRRLGDNEEKKAEEDFQIIATTNKKKDDVNIRPDFYDRFIKFTVPPLHKRRVDIFYYMLQLAPSILPLLRTWEIMSLLAYNWSGNVRELMAVSMDMESAQLDFVEKKKKSKINRRPPFSLPFAKEENTEIKFENIRRRYESMQRAGIEVSLLEELMNCHGMGFIADRNKTPWANKDFSSPMSSLEDDKEKDALLGTSTYRDDIFSDIKKGLHFYCDLFLRNQLGKVNLLSVRSEEGRSLIAPFPFEHIKKPINKHDTLVKSILEYCLRQKIEQSRRRVSLIGMDYKKYLEWIRETFNIQVLEPDEDRETMKSKLSVTVPESDLAIYENEDTLIKAWFAAWLKKYKGRRRAMFKALEINEKTGYRRLKEIGLDSHY